jgi:hypothetical protein
MTKEQWLENMQTETPDYKGLLRERDSELLSYLIKNLISNKQAMGSFVCNIMDSPETDYMLSTKHLQYLKDVGE